MLLSSARRAVVDGGRPFAIGHRVRQRQGDMSGCQGVSLCSDALAALPALCERAS